VIRTKNLTKKYESLVAVSNLNLNVEKGEIYGFLGPNGAGKTTTILMILGIVKPTAGKVTLFGKSLEEDYFGIKNRIGVASEKKNFYDEMTAQEYLNFFADLYDVDNKTKRIFAVLKDLDLYDRKDERLLGYSKGMRQKIEVARALIHDPYILILDEPAAGLDPYGIKEIRNVILEQNKRGKTVFISSHILTEIERICHRIGIINHGVLAAEDTMENIRARLADSVELQIELNRYCSKDDELIKQLSKFEFVQEIKTEDNLIKLKTDVKEDYRGQISKAIATNGETILGMNKNQISLEDAFMTITEKNVSMFTEEGDNDEQR
jgi:ABC-type multidrug transport system ATPase subunit